MGQTFGLCKYRKPEDLVGQTFGLLLVLSLDPELTIKRGRKYWRVRCDCGKEKSCAGNNLRAGQITSCGCNRGKAVNIIGQKFGKLAVVARNTSVTDKDQNAYWLCFCECGNTKTVSGVSLRKGDTKSCGCLGRVPVEKVVQGIILRNYLLNAKQRNLAWKLSFEKFVDLIQSPCHYCGSGPLSVVRYKKTSFKHNGIDRKDNTDSYTESDVVPCCKDCNYRKGTMSYNDFLAWIARVFRHQTGKAISEFPIESVQRTQAA